MGFTFARNKAEDVPALSSETILLVEDEPVVRNLYAMALRQAGYRVLEASNGAEALGVFAGASQDINLLLTDIRMPFLGGSELAAKLLAQKPELRLLYISGYPSRVELGPNSALLQKPFVRTDLLRVVRGLMDRPVASV
jgi:CheY-like chemotaxis protein